MLLPAENDGKRKNFKPDCKKVNLWFKKARTRIVLAFYSLSDSSARTSSQCLLASRGDRQIRKWLFEERADILNRHITAFRGERGIRTLGTVTRTTVFETAPFGRSGISPNSKSAQKNDKVIDKKTPAYVARVSTL